jgi:hypothetical protein
MRKVPVKSLTELEANLRRDVSDRAGGIAQALATGIAEEVKEISLNRVSPEAIVVRPKKDVVKVVVFIPASNLEVKNAALAEEVLGTRPFATVLNKLQSKEELKDILKNQGIS